MPTVAPFPQNRKELQRFQLLVGTRSLLGQGGPGTIDAAITYGVLLDPRMDRNAKWQDFLVLKDSLIRVTQGSSDQPAAIAARDKLRAHDALEPVADVFERLTTDTVFPSVSRAANFACGRAENGWIQWWIERDGRQLTLSDAFDLDSRGQLELVYYHSPPRVIWIPK